MLYTIRYLVFGIQIVGPNSTIRIRYSDFLITNSIRYSVFEFSQYRIVIDIRYSGISKSRIIFGILIRSKKGIRHTLPLLPLCQSMLEFA